MRFTVYTLVDITDSKVTDPKRRLPYSQAQNLNTILQTIDMRTQPIEWRVTHKDSTVNDYGFDFDGVHTVWRLEVEIGHDIDPEVFANDLYGVPFINNLCETVDSSEQTFDPSNTSIKRIS